MSEWRATPTRPPGCGARLLSGPASSGRANGFQVRAVPGGGGCKPTGKVREPCREPRGAVCLAARWGVWASPQTTAAPREAPGHSHALCCCPGPLSLCPPRGGQLAPQRCPHRACTRGGGQLTVPRNPGRTPPPSRASRVCGGCPCHGGSWPCRLPRRQRLTRRAEVSTSPEWVGLRASPATLRHWAKLGLTPCSRLPLSPGVDLIAAVYGCLYCGCVPVTVRPPHPQNLATTLPTVKMIVEVCACRGPPPPGSGGLPRAQVSLPPAPAAGQQVRVRAHHTGHHTAAQVQGSHGHRGHQDLADRPGHGCVCSAPQSAPGLRGLRQRGPGKTAEGRGEGAAERGPASCPPGGQRPPAGASTQLGGSLKHVRACGEQSPSSEACEPVASHAPAVLARTPIPPRVAGQCCHAPRGACGTTGRAENPWSLCLGPSRQPGAEGPPHRRYRKQAAPRRLLGDSRGTATWVPAGERTGVPSSLTWRTPDTFGRRGGVSMAPSPACGSDIRCERSVPLPTHCHRPTRSRLRAGPHCVTSP